MKKTIVTTITLFIICLTISAQDRSSFKAGFNAGLPVGDASNVSSFSVGLDVNYHWGISELLDLGFATGFINAFGESDTGFEDFQFIPAAGSVRIYPTYHFKFGADVGYAIGISDAMEGGLYYRPLVGYNITGNTELNVSYMVSEDNITFSIATVGILFLF
ncbi:MULTISPECIES: hypothetical protein [Flavobacteriaceae]|uniref:hypothetical protein n=1 Tax=Flavobacteriaceae TaxID=49546 RepID=UPI001490C0B5|nr:MULTISPECIES: hypothetical protein [Allomuricauda]MDC6367042.1 hypothetical protein [Muricauda sp. AC10]